MWMGHDSSWWGLAIGLTCLVLSIPLAIIGNLLSPKVRIWWTVRSLGSGTKKLNGLMALMQRVQSEPELDHSAAAILRVLKDMTRCMFLLAYSILLAIIFGMGADLTAKPPRFRPGYVTLLIAVALIQVGGFTYAQVKIQRALRTSAAEKERMNNEFEHAKAKLQKIVDRTEKANASGGLG